MTYVVILLTTFVSHSLRSSLRSFEMHTLQPLLTFIHAYYAGDTTAQFEGMTELADVLCNIISDVPVAYIQPLRQALTAEDFDDCFVSSALVNGRLDIVQACEASGWTPSQEFVHAHTWIIADARTVPNNLSPETNTAIDVWIASHIQT